MRLHRFYLDKKISAGENGAVFVSDEKIIHQWKKVLRLGAGDRVAVFDGLEENDFECEIVSLENRAGAELKIIRKIKNENVPRRKITLFQSTTKKDNFELVVAKGTEIGVSRFVPVISQRCEKKKINMERLLKIVRESAEQSGRASVPEIDKEISLKQAVLSLSIPALSLHPSGSILNTKYDIPNTIGVFVGPEGGWSDEELALFSDKKIPLVSFGKMTLRSETAGISAAVLLLLSGDK